MSFIICSDVGAYTFNVKLAVACPMKSCTLLMSAPLAIIDVYKRQRHHRIHVNDRLAAELVVQLLFHIVDLVVQSENIACLLYTSRCV